MLRLIKIILLGILATLLWVTTLVRVARADSAPAVEAQQVGDVYVVQGHFEVPAWVSRDVAWSVLTDYAHIGQFVGSVRESRIVSRDAQGLLLEQQLQGKLMMFSRTAHVLLRVTEVPDQSLEFVDVGRQDFELYRGTWELREGQDGLTVSYLLRAKPRHGPPALLGARAIDDGVSELLQGVRNEMEARAARALHARN